MNEKYFEIKKGKTAHAYVLTENVLVYSLVGTQNSTACLQLCIKIHRIHLVGYIHPVILYHGIPNMFQLIPSPNMLHTWHQL